MAGPGPDTDNRKVIANVDIVRANRNRNITESPAFASYYTNDTQIQTTPWDVRMIFGQIVEVDQENSRVTVQTLADVRMSPQHAKRISTILQQQIQQYEAKMGTIPQPPEND